ncbi:hypothetical protein U879_09640 [Defluviimonas sp. 20V17]|nr:hypothetical protein U879_09640 [Defluviimonas sp. 20V17]
MPRRYQIDTGGIGIGHSFQGECGMTIADWAVLFAPAPRAGADLRPTGRVAGPSAPVNSQGNGERR